MRTRSVRVASRRGFHIGLLGLASGLLLGCGKSKEQMAEELLVAARVGNTAAVKSLIGNGVDVNVRRHPQGWTALHYAASGAYLEIVEMLLKAGADASARGASNAHSSPGPLITATPRVVAQSSIMLVGPIRAGRVRFEATPEGGMQASDEDAVRRYEAIVALLAAAEGKVSSPK